MSTGGFEATGKWVRLQGKGRLGVCRSALADCRSERSEQIKCERSNPCRVRHKRATVKTVVFLFIGKT